MIRPSYYLANSGTKVKLDPYISDLNLELNPEGYSCQPLFKDGFAYMWAGAKANYGIRAGKVCYEVKVAENLDVSTADFTDIHVVRLGWSTDAANLQLGEDTNSYGYGGTGKKSEARKFADYGRRFGKGDVIGCYLSIENGWAEISYCINGRHAGIAYKLRWNSEQALYPHILTKNCRLEINFGQAPNPYFSLQPGFKLIDHIPAELKIPSVQPPTNKAQCEVIMMVGLPGVGKSTWASNYAKIHPSKKYNILGTDAIIDKMRVQGLPRKNNFGGRWDILIKQASECFNILLKKASTCNRNLILDQTNVYASARKRKVKQYKDAGYTVNAMVLVPTDEEMMRRSNRRTREEGKEVPETAVLDMKANFSLPHEDENLFDKITFLELQRGEAENLVLQYNADANIKGYKSNRQSGAGANLNQRERNDRSRSSSRPQTDREPPHDHRNNERPDDSKKRGDLRYHERDSMPNRERGRSQERRGNPIRHWDDREKSAAKDEHLPRSQADRRQEPRERYRKDLDSRSDTKHFSSYENSRSNPNSRQMAPEVPRKPVSSPAGHMNSPRTHDRSPFPSRLPEKNLRAPPKQEPHFSENDYGSSEPNAPWSVKQEYQERNFEGPNFYELKPKSQQPGNRHMKSEAYFEGSGDAWPEEHRVSDRKNPTSDYAMQRHHGQTGSQHEKISDDHYSYDQSDYGNSSMKLNYHMQQEHSNPMHGSLDQDSGHQEEYGHYPGDHTGEEYYEENWNEEEDYSHSEQIDPNQKSQYNEHNQWGEQTDYEAEDWNTQDDGTTWNESHTYYEEDSSAFNTSRTREQYLPRSDGFNEGRGRGRGRGLGNNGANRSTLKEDYGWHDQRNSNQPNQSGYDDTEYQEPKMENPSTWRSNVHQPSAPAKGFPPRPQRNDSFSSNTGPRMPPARMVRPPALRNPLQPHSKGMRQQIEGNGSERNFERNQNSSFRQQAPYVNNQRFDAPEHTDLGSVRPRFGQTRMNPGMPRNTRPRMPGRGTIPPHRMRFPNNQSQYSDQPSKRVEDSSISSLTSVDFDKLKASLANLRQAEEMQKTPTTMYPPYNEDQEPLNTNFPEEGMQHQDIDLPYSDDYVDDRYHKPELDEYSRPRRDKVPDESSTRSQAERRPSERYHDNRDINSPSDRRDRQIPRDESRGGRHSDLRERSRDDTPGGHGRRDRPERYDHETGDKHDHGRSRNDFRDQARRGRPRESERSRDRSHTEHREENNNKARGDIRDDNYRSEKYSRRSPVRRQRRGDSRERHQVDNPSQKGRATTMEEPPSAPSRHRRLQDSAHDEMEEVASDNWNQLEATQNLVRKDFRDRESSKRLSNHPPSGSPPVKQPRPEGILPGANIQRVPMRPSFRVPPPRGPKPGLLETPTPDNLISEEMYMHDEEDDAPLELPPGPAPHLFFPRPGPRNPQLMGPRRMFRPRGFRGNRMRIREGFRPMRPRFSSELGPRRGGMQLRPRMQPDRMMGPRQPRRGFLNYPRGLMRPRMRPPGMPRMRHPI